MSDKGELVSIKIACGLVGVSRRTIYNWMTAGKIEYVRTAGGPVRIYKNTLWRSDNASPFTGALNTRRRNTEKKMLSTVQ